MKRYVVRNKTTNEVLGKFDTKNQASESITDFMDYYNNYNEYCPEDEGFLSIFDFEVNEEDLQEISNYEEALSYLCGLSESINTRHEKALKSLEKLFVIAQACNKQDGFVPDFSNEKQLKFFPWFKYDKNAERFVYARAFEASASAFTSFGSRICFNTPERANQFGEQFIDLWNDVFLLEK